MTDWRADALASYELAIAALRAEFLRLRRDYYWTAEEARAWLRRRV